MTSQTAHTVRVACIGECMVELSPAENGLFKQAFAGDTLNTAIYIARTAAHAIDTSYITAIGKDSFSDRMIDFFQSENINCQWISRLPEKVPGLYAIELDAYGERSFSYWRTDSAARALFSHGLTPAQRSELAESFDLYYLSGISLAILDEGSRELLKKTLTRARERGAKVAFDSNYRPRLWSSREQAQSVTSEFLALTDIALVTFDDEQALFGDQSITDTMNRLSAIPEVVIKQGGDGCSIMVNQALSFVPATVVRQIVDTTSAGDSFNGGYLARRMSGDAPETAAAFAHRLAASVIQYKGAIIPKSATSRLLEQTQPC